MNKMIKSFRIPGKQNCHIEAFKGSKSFLVKLFATLKPILTIAKLFYNYLLCMYTNISLISRIGPLPIRYFRKPKEILFFLKKGPPTPLSVFLSSSEQLNFDNRVLSVCLQVSVDRLTCITLILIKSNFYRNINYKLLNEKSSCNSFGSYKEISDFEMKQIFSIISVF